MESERNVKLVGETNERKHPSHPIRELALQLAVSAGSATDHHKTIVDRAEAFAAFLAQA